MILFHTLLLFILSSSSCFFRCSGDIYLHNPRGSNNRLDESSRERANEKRLFDSQNNNRGGYNVGGLYYIVGSKLNVEWTNQHSCGDNTQCEIVIQYMCSDTLRDGTETGTIKINNDQCYKKNCLDDPKYGMHEDINYYEACRYRKRNAGLFTASQKLQGQTARYTRQNPNGIQYAYECPEERDHYPYWHPTPWIDLAVLTNNISRCNFYKTESQNVKEKGQCMFTPYELSELKKTVTNPEKNGLIPNNEEDCRLLKGRWILYKHEKPSPECRYVNWSRDNHLGNGKNGFPNGWNWTLPDDVNEQCSLRVRYNITTSDYDGWSVDSSKNPASPGGDVIALNIAEKYGSSKENGYVFKTNPEVNAGYGFKFQLNIDTAQFGRTFQDRTHAFAIRARPADISADAVIQNINVRGKRGNIVQNFPAVEYDFVPNRQTISKGDYIHFQWTGSNTNPNGAGQGKQQTDRSNIVILKNPLFPQKNLENDELSTFGDLGANKPGLLDLPFLGLNHHDRNQLSILGTISGNVKELDDGPVTFDMSPRRVTALGIFHYMCTRNNNFSNRSQKGKLVSTNDKIVTNTVDPQGQVLTLPGATVEFPKNSVVELNQVFFKSLSLSTSNKKLNELIASGGITRVSNVFNLGPEDINFSSDGRFTMKISFPSTTLSPTILFTTSLDQPFHKIDATFTDKQIAQISSNTPGYFIVSSDYNQTTLIISSSVVTGLMAILYGGVIAFLVFKRNTS